MSRLFSIISQESAVAAGVSAGNSTVIGISWGAGVGAGGEKLARRSYRYTIGGGVILGLRN